MQFNRKGGNLYREGANGWLALKNYQLPTPRTKTENHHPGGGVMEIEVPIGAIEPLTLGFNVVGADPAWLGGFGLSLYQSSLYTIYEALVDEQTGTMRERIVTMRGIMAEATPEEMAGRGLKGYGYQIKSITEFEDVIEGYGIIARFNFRTNAWTGYGIESDSAELNRILRITG